MRATEKRKGDYLFLGYLAAALIFGLIMLTSASSPLGKERFGDGYFFIKRQFLFGFLPGMAGLIFFSKLTVARLKIISLPLFVTCVLLLIFVLIPGIGDDFGKGARSWLVFFGFSFQPAELAKLALALYLPAVAVGMGGRLQKFKEGFLPFLAIGLLPVALIVLQPDVGSVSILFSIIFGLLFLAGAPIRHLGALALIGMAALAMLIKIAPYRIARLTTFLHPELDPQGIGYHINQAFLAIGSGGLFGLGFGHSRQKFQYLPEVHADSIFAIIAEEMGFLVTAMFLVLLLLLCYRGFMIARQAKDEYSRLVAAAITVWFMSQALLNIGAIVGLLPLTGVPLPFVSHGGTSLVIAMAGAGALFAISKETEI